MAYLHHAPRTMTVQQTRGVGALAMPRRRGASTGTLLVLLGIWGGVIPFIGPTFGYRMDDTASWTFTMDRLWLSILPGAAALLGGLILLGVANRLSASVGAWLALAAGIWFVVGPTVSLLWDSPIGQNGVGADTGTQRFIEQIGFSYGLGALVTALAAGALARVLVRSERDTALLEASTASTVTADDTAATAGTYPDEPVAGSTVTDGTGAGSTVTDTPVTDTPAGGTAAPERTVTGPAPASTERTVTDTGRRPGDSTTGGAAAPTGESSPAAQASSTATGTGETTQRPGRLSWPEDEDDGQTPH